MENRRYRQNQFSYDGERYVPGQTARNVTEDHVRRYQHVKKIVMNQRVLDIACGSGFGMKILSSSSPSIIGIDYSLDAVFFAKINFMKLRDYGVQADALSIPFCDDSFDAAVSFETIEHLKDPIKFLNEVKRVLIPGGLFFISTPVKKSSRLDRFHIHEYTINEFIDLLSRFFTIESIEGQRFMFSPLFVIFSLELINKLRRIDFVKQLYRKCYGKNEIRLLRNSFFFTPNFILVTCKNEK